MKQLALLLFMLFIFGCSSDNNQNIPLTNSIKKITEKFYSQGTVNQESSADFNYSSGKLISITDNNQNMKGEFIYDGNKITSYKYYKNSVLQSENVVIYNGNELTETIGDERKTTFSYNNNKVSSKKNYDFDGLTYSLIEQSDFNYNGNNIESIVSMTNYNGTPFYFKTSYDFDTKNTMFKNMNPYLEFIFNFESILNFSLNNVNKSYRYESVDSTAKILWNNYTILYNSSDYPISIKKYSATSSQLISELTIQYN